MTLDVRCVDNFKGTKKFFDDLKLIRDYVALHKEYSNPCEIKFLSQDYIELMEINEVDLIISQFAGFVGQATKKYLKLGGLLLCNDSHGDATLAYADPDYEFLGAILYKNSKYEIDFQNKHLYFILPKGKQLDLEWVYLKMKSPKYIVQAENYLFRKIK